MAAGCPDGWSSWPELDFIAAPAACSTFEPALRGLYGVTMVAYAAIAVLIAATTLRAWSPDKAMRRLPSIAFGTLGCVIGALRFAGEPGTQRLGHDFFISFLVSLVAGLVYFAAGSFIGKYVTFLVKQAQSSGCNLGKDLQELRRALSVTSTFGLLLFQLLTVAAMVPAEGALLARVWLVVWYAFNVAITIVLHLTVGRVQTVFNEFLSLERPAGTKDDAIDARLRKLLRGLQIIDRNLKIYLTLFTATLMPGVFVTVWSSALKYLVPGIFDAFGLFWIVNTVVMLPSATAERKGKGTGKMSSHASSWSFALTRSESRNLSSWFHPLGRSARKITPSETGRAP